jgi:hypothetical protein
LIEWLIVLYLYPDENRLNKISVGENVVLGRNYCLRIFDLDFWNFSDSMVFYVLVFHKTNLRTHYKMTWTNYTVSVSHHHTLSVSHVFITYCQLPMYLSHLVSFPCTNHTLSVSYVPITPCKFPMYPSHHVSFPCTYHTLSVSHVPITPCQFPLYLSHLVSFPGIYHTLSVSHVSITPCHFSMYLSHLVSFPCIYHTLSVSHVPTTPCKFPMYLSHLVSFPCIYHSNKSSKKIATAMSTYADVMITTWCK